MGITYAGQFKKGPVKDPRSQWPEAQNPLVGGAELAEDMVGGTGMIAPTKYQEVPEGWPDYSATSGDTPDPQPALQYSPPEQPMNQQVQQSSPDDQQAIEDNQLQQIQDDSLIFEEYGGPSHYSGQPPAKISAVPGKSGSSEVFRTNMGAVPNPSLVEEYDESKEEEYYPLKCLSCGFVSKGFHMQFESVRTEFTKHFGALSATFGHTTCLRCGSGSMSYA